MIAQYAWTNFISGISSIHIGAALEGYVAMPGIGRNSYGYDSEGNILLESELSPNDVPTFNAGDISKFILYI